MKNPTAYMFTIQLNNLINKYGKNKVKFKWKKYIDNPKHLPPVETQLDKHISNMVQYYGIDYAKQWFKDMGFKDGLQ